MRENVPRHQIGYAIAAVIGMVLLIAVCMFPQARIPVQKGRQNDLDESGETYPITYAGDSSQLKQTAILPTLDTPIPDANSAIWCASFVYAWNELKTKIAKGPIQVKNAEVVADRLNRAQQAQTDVASGTSYALAGLVKDGAIERIQLEMGRQFPDVPILPELTEPGDQVVVAYAYLQASVKYKHRFFNNRERFEFTDSAGNKTAVRSFGIREEDTNKDAKLDSFRGQVRVLWEDRDKDQFAIDPCYESSPNQILLAKMPRKATLAETLAELEAKIQASTPSQLHPEDSLLVPNLHWRIAHHFRELEGRDKLLLNPSLVGLYVGTAFQVIKFKLDREGAELASEALVFFSNGGPHAYHFDKPFLIVMRKRDARQPFFLMWVENAELLSKS